MLNYGDVMVNKVAIYPRPSIYNAAFRLEDSAKSKKGLDGWVQRHVLWLNTEPHWSKTLLKATECAVLILSMVGIVLLNKGINYSNRLKSYAAFEAKKREGAQPPPFKTVKVKSNTASFNHVNYYAIQDKMLWFKPKDQPDAPWQAFYFDGIAQGRIPEELRVDGANLVVKDDKNTIHYKKVLHEYRVDSPDEKYGRYEYVDKTLKDNWKDRWFVFPVFHHIVNFFSNKLLKIPDDVIAWSISHRALYNRFYIDEAGKIHIVEVPITSLYALYKGSNDSYIADPWLPFGFKRILSELGIGMNHIIKGPEDEDYTAFDIDSSASTMVQTGKDAKGRLKIYTRQGDFDTEGRNPFLNNTDDPAKAVDNKVRYTGGRPAWKLHPLPADAKITGSAKIFQTGVGNEARELQIDAENGYYTKNITDPEWTFRALRS